MSGGYYRSGQAARVWAISSHLVRRLCEAGLIEAERTGGGQWKIPHFEVERIKKEGVPEIPSSIEQDYRENEEDEDSPPETGLPERPSDGVAPLAAENMCAGNLKKLRMQSFEQDSERGERQAVLDKAAYTKAEQDRVEWQDSWLATALRSLPREAPAEIRLVVREAVTEALEGLGPRHSWHVIDPLVSAAVSKAMRPWKQERETESAIQIAGGLLPWGAKNPFLPTVWQTRAHQVAAASLRKLPPDSTFGEKLRVGSAAVRQITGEYEDDEIRRKIVREAFLLDICPEDQEDAKESIQRQLENLPLGTPARTMERSRDQALAPFREAKKRKVRVDLALKHIEAYLERLRQEGETDFESNWEVWNFARSVEGGFRTVLVREMQNGDLSDDELLELIEELVEEELA